MEREKSETHLQALKDIRDMMQKSSRFISLSGLSGISAGIIALIGGGLAYWKEKKNFEINENNYSTILSSNDLLKNYYFFFCFIDAILMILLAITFAIFFTVKKSKKTGQSIWDASAKKLLINLCIPLIVGGLFCISIVLNQVYYLLSPSMLIFYGLALINASKYTIHDVQSLAYCQVVLGIVSLFFPGYGWICWMLGFGLFHIVYGIGMYLKYEK